MPKDHSHRMIDHAMPAQHQADRVVLLVLAPVGQTSDTTDQPSQVNT